MHAATMRAGEPRPPTQPRTLAPAALQPLLALQQALDRPLASALELQFRGFSSEGAASKGAADGSSASASGDAAAEADEAVERSIDELEAELKERETKLEAMQGQVGVTPGGGGGGRLHQQPRSRASKQAWSAQGRQGGSALACLEVPRANQSAAGRAAARPAQPPRGLPVASSCLTDPHCLGGLGRCKS